MSRMSMKLAVKLFNAKQGAMSKRGSLYTGNAAEQFDATIDVEIENHGSIFTVEPKTDAARKWIDENVQSEGYQWMGPRLCVEHRYIGDIVAGMNSAGLNAHL